MDEARFVDGLQGEREPVGQDPHRPLGQRPVLLGHDGVQIGPGNVLRRDPGRLRVRVRVEHCRGPAPADPLRRGDLAREPRAELGVLGELGLHDLDRDSAPAFGAGEVDPAHAAGA